MKISLLEPLNVSEALIEELSAPLKEAGHEFVYYSEKTQDPEELYERSKDAEIVTIANNPLPNEVVARLDKTQLINVAFTGVDHVGLDAAKEQGILVANASGYANTAVAELSIGLVLGLYRQLIQGHEDTKKGSSFPGPIKGMEIHGKTVGILGTGTIGLETAKLFKAFGARILGYNRSEKEEAKEIGIEYCSLDELLQESDIVSVHLPLTDETRHTIGARELELMKESAVLINVARGPVIDNKALARALEAGQIAGAGIDVFDGEPPLSDDYPLLKAPNTLLAPHIGFLTAEAMEKRARIVFDNINAFIDGEPQNIIKY